MSSDTRAVVTQIAATLSAHEIEDLSGALHLVVLNLKRSVTRPAAERQDRLLDADDRAAFLMAVGECAGLRAACDYLTEIASLLHTQSNERRLRAVQ